MKTMAGALEADQALALKRPALRGYFHLVALIVVLCGGPFFVLSARNASGEVAMAIYMASLCALFGVSAAYHRVRWSQVARRRWRRVDHATIFLAIAGTYTAVGDLALSGVARTAIFVVVWGGAVIGVGVRELWLEASKVVIAIPYVVVGWCALFVAPQLLHGLGGIGFALLLTGGASYTAGAIVYGLRRPNPSPKVFGYHEVFHALTIVGAGLQFGAIAAYAR